jgi:RNA polymerase sigma-70 factor (ECF subfamily)
MTLPRTSARFADPESRFRAAFASHYPAVYGYAARRVGRDEAADAAAVTFEVAWRRIRSLPDEPDTLPWLYGVARRVVANTLRSRRRRERLAARTAALVSRPDDGPEPDDILTALERVSHRDREVLRLAAWEGLGPDDLGTVLGCSPNAASVRLHRARRRLSAAVDQLEEGGEA